MTYNYKEEQSEVIELTQGYCCTVSLADYDMLMKHRWYAHKSRTGIYARATIDGKKVRMHRLLVGEIPTYMQVDHIDRDTLNNCRSNLRIVTQAENQKNRRAQRRDK